MKTKTKRRTGPRVEAAMRALGHSVRSARLARNMTMRDLALRAGLSLATLKRLEGGDPSVASAHLLSCFFILGLMAQLVASVTSSLDGPGEALRGAARQRARSKGGKVTPGDDLDF